MKLDNRKDEILSMYDDGMTIYKIAKSIGEYEQAVSNLLRKHIDIPKNEYYAFNESYFETIDSEDKAYFLGFIAADGCIAANNKGTKILTISLAEKDRSVLESFKECLEAEQPIKELARQQVRFVVARKKIIEDIEKYDIGERKSLTMGPILQNIPDDFKSHFLRGYFDGDGSIFQTKTGSKEMVHYVAIRGTKEFLEELQEYCGIKGALQFNTGTHQWRFGAKSDVLKFRDIIYSDSIHHLQRKYDKFPW